jgi:hypothetical protein
MERPPDPGTVAVGGDVVAQMRYTRNNLWLKHLLGSFTNGQYKLADTREGMGLSIAVDKQVSPWGISGGKLSQVVIASAIDRVTLTATIVARHIERPSTVNSFAVLRALPYSADTNVLQRHLTFWLGDLQNALNVGDVWHPTGLTVTLARPVDQVFTDEGPEIIEPLDSGFPTFTMAFPLARHMSDQFKDWQAGHTPLQARAYWTNGPHSLEIIFPSLHLQTAPTPTTGPGPLGTTVTLHASEGSQVYTASDISAAAADNSLNSAGATFPYFHIGALVEISGFTGAPGNNKRGTVLTRTNGQITFDMDITLADDAAGEPVTLHIMNPPIIVRET